MDVQEAIYKRRSVRHYTDQPVDKATVMALLQAAVQAPNAVNHQPWVFAVVQDRARLKDYSDRVKELFAKSEELSSMPPEIRTMIADPGYNIFYNAGTLIIICAKPIGQHPDWDCCLAGQNLMLAAFGMGLGTCPIGFAWRLLEIAEVKRELQIAPEYTAVLPIIVGYPAEMGLTVPRNEPEIVSWK